MKNAQMIPLLPGEKLLWQQKNNVLDEWGQAITNQRIIFKEGIQKLNPPEIFSQKVEMHQNYLFVKWADVQVMSIRLPDREGIALIFWAFYNFEKYEFVSITDLTQKQYTNLKKILVDELSIPINVITNEEKKAIFKYKIQNSIRYLPNLVLFLYLWVNYFKGLYLLVSGISLGMFWIIPFYLMINKKTLDSSFRLFYSRYFIFLLIYTICYIFIMSILFRFTPPAVS